MRIAILIPPGFAQHNISEKLAKEHDIPVIKIKDLLLQEVSSGSELGLDIKKQVDNSKPVSDDNIISVVSGYFTENPHNEGFLMEGMPRNEVQASALDKILADKDHKLQGLIFLNLNYDRLMELQTGRLICRECSAIFNIYYKPPHIDKICDDCGSRLYQRVDDREETISRRIREFENYLDLLNKYYNDTQLKIIISNIDVDEIYQLSNTAFKALGKNSTQTTKSNKKSQSLLLDDEKIVA